MRNRPKWLENAIFYEIYPQSFKDTNGDGIGDLRGIIQKLGYIERLGCNAIWINPCFVSPFGDAGYDVEDYYTIAPRYGTNEDMAELFREAHKRGMHVILDLVPGHTAVTHKWFKESLKAEKNEFSDRYVWTDSIWEEPGMCCIKGISDRDGCCGVNFFSHQPALNYGFYERDPEKKWQQSPDDPAPVATREAMKDVMRFWLKAGCDGFRVDMAGSLVKNDPDGKGTIKLWQNIREFLDGEFPEAAIISEWGEPDKSLEGGFHMDFLLHFGPSRYNDLFRCPEPWFSSRGKGDIREFLKKYTENYAKAKDGLICIPSGNHDMDRLARGLSQREMKIAFAFLLTMPGAPFIYYGDEIGMRYVEGLTSVEGGYGRTGSRSPMQWDDSVNCGFSTASPEKLYIPMDSAVCRPTAAGQACDENSLYNEVKKLIEIRKDYPALQNTAEWELICGETENYPLIYLRGSGNEQMAVVINPGNDEREANIGKTALGKSIYTFGGEVWGKSGKVIVPGGSAGIYTVK
ncbi:MAG: glycosylase [Oscillospiraceae bacterium]|nr:glycosylase [Oscillospiraceae bacterium]